MKTYINEHKLFGKTLFAESGDVVIGIPLDYGIRIAYLSYKGSDNLFFEQPRDMTALTTADGWRIYGGHRLWIAPEGKHLYHPDNDPISYEITEDKIILRQKKDPRINVEKTMEIEFLSDNSLKILHRIKNAGPEKRGFSVWPITCVAPNGIQHIPLRYAESGPAPLHKISTWYYTSLGDSRASYTRTGITLKHAVAESLYKIGIGHPVCPITYTNKGVTFEKSFEICPDMEYPDGNVSYETYMCDHMVEMESLSPFYTVEPGDCAEHTEIWTLKN